MKKIIVAVICLFLAGCAAPNHSIPPQFWQNKQQAVAISNGKAIHGTMLRAGAEGIADIIVNNIVTSKFDNYISGYSSLPIQRQLQAKLISGLRARHVKAYKFRAINIKKLKQTGLDNKQYTERDYRPFAANLGNHKLLIIQPLALGAFRKYAEGIIPLGSPRAYIVIEGIMVNTRNNSVIWRYTSTAKLKVNGHWNQPPNYPDFTKTMDKAATLVQKQFLNAFFASAPK